MFKSIKFLFLFGRTIRLTGMIIFMKEKLKISVRQTNNEKYRVAAHKILKIIKSN